MEIGIMERGQVKKAGEEARRISASLDSRLRSISGHIALVGFDSDGKSPDTKLNIGYSSIAKTLNGFLEGRNMPQDAYLYLGSMSKRADKIIGKDGLRSAAKFILSEVRDAEQWVSQPDAGQDASELEIEDADDNLAEPKSALGRFQIALNLTAVSKGGTKLSRETMLRANEPRMIEEVGDAIMELIVFAALADMFANAISELQGGKSNSVSDSAKRFSGRFADNAVLPEKLGGSPVETLLRGLKAIT